MFALLKQEQAVKNFMKSLEAIRKELNHEKSGLCPRMVWYGEGRGRTSCCS